MRAAIGLLGVTVAGVLLFLASCGVVNGAVPVTSRLADVQGVGTVTIAGLPTARLRGKVWVRRVGGTAIATVEYTARCSKRENNVVTAAVRWATLKLRPNQERLVWTYTDRTPCTLSFTATGSGRLRLVVRGN